MGTELHHFSLEALADNCIQESSKKNPQSRDDRFCYELVLRAFGLEDHEALGLVLTIYKSVWSRFWIVDEPVFNAYVFTADDFRSIAFFKVYQQTKGSDFHSAFTALNPFLAYLRITLVRTVAAYIRSPDARRRYVHSKPEQEVADMLEQIAAPDNPSHEVEKNLQRQAIEQRLHFLLPDEKDRFLFDCWLNRKLSRSEIVREFVARWDEEKNTFDENAVRVALQRIRRRLMKDSILYNIIKHQYE
jgi:hypothetical protein